MRPSGVNPFGRHEGVAPAPSLSLPTVSDALALQHFFAFPDRPADFWLGIAAIVLLVELSRRTVGKEFTLILFRFLLYTYLGKFIPGQLSHKMSSQSYPGGRP